MSHSFKVREIPTICKCSVFTIEYFVSTATVENVGDKDSHEIRDNFIAFLHDYINRNKLKCILPTKIKDILVSKTFLS